MNPQEHEQYIISYIKNPDNYNNIVKLGITSDTFTFHKEIFDFIEKYYSKYGNIPKNEIILSSFPGFSYINVDSGDVKYHIDELKNFEFRRKASDILHRGVDLINMDVNNGLDYLISNLSGIRKPYIISDSWTDADALKRLEQYKGRADLKYRGGNLEILLLLLVVLVKENHGLLNI